MIKRPIRLHRTRRANAITPPGAIYVGRPTLFSNPFSPRPRIGHARSVILYRSWLEGDLSPHVLRRAGFSESEINTLGRWRTQLIPALRRLRGPGPAMLVPAYFRLVPCGYAAAHRERRLAGSSAVNPPRLYPGWEGLPALAELPAHLGKGSLRG